MSDVVLVVPTIREQSIRQFLEAWSPYDMPYTIVVEDNPTKTFDLEFSGAHYAWDDIDFTLKKSSRIIPRRTDGIRSFGFLMALRLGAEYIITLDDDCLPYKDTNPFEGHPDFLMTQRSSPAWGTTMEGLTPRGIPYFNDYRSFRPVVNIGLWKGVPDLDAPTQLLTERREVEVILRPGVGGLGTYIPMCGMNLAFRRVMLPAMYFPLMGLGYKYDRFGDIWCGILVKRICDHLRLAMTYGEPYVVHSRASDVFENLQKEASALQVNEYFWEAIDKVILTGRTVADCYQQLAIELPLILQGRYWGELSEAMLKWLALVEMFGD